MKVRAIEKGYYAHKRRQIGDVFILKPYKKTIEEKDKFNRVIGRKVVTVTPEQQFSQAWMEAADAREKLRETKPQKQFGPNIQSQPDVAKSTHEPRDYAAEGEGESEEQDQDAEGEDSSEDNVI